MSGWQVVMNSKDGEHIESLPVSSEAEGREVARAQSRCYGQRCWRVHVTKDGVLVANFKDGIERGLATGKRRPAGEPKRPRRPPTPVGEKSWSVSIHGPFGAHFESLPMTGEAEAVAFAETDGRRLGRRMMVYTVVVTYPSGQKTKHGRWRKGRRLAR